MSAAPARSECRRVPRGPALGVLAVLGLLAGAAWGGEKAAGDRGGGFADVTAESGVGAVVAEHYRRVPKWWLSGLTLVDLDGDGDLDLHLAGHGCPAAAAANDGKGRFTYVDPKLAIPRGVRKESDLPYPGGEIRLACDFTEDGRVDLHCSWHDGGGAGYLNDTKGPRGAGRPPILWNFRRSHALDHFNRATALADMDRDGNVDYLADAGGRKEPGVLILFGKGDGTFGRKRLIPGALEEGGAVPVDIDGDGDLDLLLTRRGYNPPGRRILLNDGRLNFTDVTKRAGLTARGGSIHGAGDLDHDGDLDLICVEADAFAVYLNDGRGRFTPRPDAVAGMAALRASARPRSANWGGAVVTDLDNDGLADVLINGKYFLHVLRGTRRGRLAVATSAWHVPAGAWSAVDEGLCFGDIDADGDLDLVTCGRGPGAKQKGASVYRNDLARRPSRASGRRGWIRLRLTGRRGNRAAAGAKIRLYEAGGLGDRERLLWYEQVAIWGRQSFHSYYAASATERHFGLGAREAVDLCVEFYPSGRRVERRRARSGATVEVREAEAPSPRG